MRLPARLWLVPIYVLCMAACVPTTKAMIPLGNGYGATEMDRLEAVVEKVGFTRRVFDGPRATAHRIQRDGRIVSAFETQAPARFAATVSWSRADGSLAVEFAEYDTRFSPGGQALLQRLKEELQNIYGERVLTIGAGKS
jgi:putative intracellular protease/amidase